MVYNGAAYRTLDDAPSEGGRLDNPNRGCQCTDLDANGKTWDNCISGHSQNVLPLPPGYELAANDVDSVAVIAAHGWSTTCVVLADGSAWRSANHGRAGDRCGSGRLASSGGSHTVTSCWRRVLARCP